MLAKRMLLGVLILFVVAMGTRAQETTATISGQVADESGAVISDAEITLTNAATRQELRTKSNEIGYYQVSFVPPGIYDLSIKAEGFKEYQNKGLELLVNDKKVINVTLSAGAITESVTVTADLPIIQNTPMVGDAIENRRVVELPLNNRNFLQLVTLVPGVSVGSEDAETGVGLTSRTDLAINGGRRNAINFLVDGVSNVDVGSNITLLSTPTVDSIREFRVITAIPMAEFGRSGGGVVNLVTQGGGREYHGSAYEFLRNDRLNANSFFGNAAGRVGDRGETPGIGQTVGDLRAPVPVLRYNNFGWTFGGPVWIPKLYSRRNEKTFFFFSEEWRRIIRGTAGALVRVPSLRERRGDFSQGTARIFDPVTGQEFANRQIQANRIDPTAAGLLNLFPEPTIAATTPNVDANRIFVRAPAVQNTRQETVRVDHTLNQNHRLMARYTRDLSETVEVGGLFTSLALPNIATTETTVPGHILVASLTSTFGSSMVNELSFNFSRNSISTDNLGRYNRDNVQINNKELFPDNKSNLPPSVNTGLGLLVAIQQWSNNYSNFNPRDTITWQRGSHTIKAGADVSFEHKNEFKFGVNTQGQFSFTGLQTARAGVSGSGIGFADFLLGRASSYTEEERDLLNQFRFGRTEFFIQDSWKARPNLQLDYGLRYQLYRLPVDKDNLISVFLPELFDPAAAPQFANQRGSLIVVGTGDPLNGIAVAGVNSPFGRRAQEISKDDFSPRLGFAWDPWKDGKTVVRGGYGIYYEQTLVGTLLDSAQNNLPFLNRSNLTGTATNPITYDNPAAGVGPTQVGLPTLFTTTAPYITPVTQQWSVTIQRQLNRTAAFEIGYTGTAGNHLLRPVDINAPTPQEILAASKGIVGCDPALAATNNPNNCINLARPFKGIGSITDRQTTATSRYHGLLTSFKLQPTRGLTAQVAYTYSKNITDATNDRDGVDLPQVRSNFAIERAVSRFDRTHVFVASYVYEVPYPKQGFLALPLFKHVLGGWQVAGITRSQSGLPVTRIIQGTASGPRGNRVNIVGDPFKNVPTNVAGGAPYFFNPLAFRPTAVGGIGDAGRAIFRFPSSTLTDFEIGKNWRWGEHYRVQIRAEFFNFFNQTVFISAGQVIPDRLPTDVAFTSLEEFLKTGSAFGQFTGTRRPREIQFGMKFYF